MKLYIFANRDLHDDKPHIFYSEDFTPDYIGNQYQVLKSFFVDWLDPNDSPFLEDEPEYDHFVRQVEGRLAIVIPKGDIITITDLDNNSFEFDDRDIRFTLDHYSETPMCLKLTNKVPVTCGVMASEYDDSDDFDEEPEDDYHYEDIYDDDYDPNSYGQRSEEWYLAKYLGEDTDPYL